MEVKENRLQLKTTPCLRIYFEEIVDLTIQLYDRYLKNLYLEEHELADEIERLGMKVFDIMLVDLFGFQRSGYAYFHFRIVSNYAISFDGAGDYRFEHLKTRLERYSGENLILNKLNPWDSHDLNQAVVDFHIPFAYGVGLSIILRIVKFWFDVVVKSLAKAKQEFSNDVKFVKLNK